MSQSSSELNRIALEYLRRLRAEGLGSDDRRAKSTKVEVLKPYEKRTDAGSREGTSIKIITILALLAASLPVHAQDTIQPTSHYWARLSSVRQLGYVEGFNAGVLSRLGASSCESYPRVKKTPLCILHAWQQKTQVDVDANAVLETVAKLYADPKNEPLRWSTVVIIAEAMVSGVSIDETDFNILREYEAKLGTHP